MTWLLNEAAALKTKLSTIRVHSSTNEPEGRLVPVKYVGPDFELSDAFYPGIYLQMGPALRATDREHEGSILLPYAPEGYTGNVQVPVDMSDKENLDTEPWMIPGSFGDPLASPYAVDDVPVPYNLRFDVAVYTRNYQEGLELTSILATLPYLPERFGFLEIPEDGTIRTLELVGGPEMSMVTDPDDKRVIQILYSVSVTSELSLYDIRQINRVDTVDLTVTEYDPLFPPV